MEVSVGASCETREGNCSGGSQRRPRGGGSLQMGLEACVEAMLRTGRVWERAFPRRGWGGPRTDTKVSLWRGQLRGSPVGRKEAADFGFWLELRQWGATGGF